MTRINVVPVWELSNPWLLAEYRELPRCIKQLINTDNASEQYILNKGHMKWAKKHSLYLLRRYKDICEEMRLRGFKVTYSYEDLCRIYISPVNCNDYVVTDADIALNRKRLIERYKANPGVHKWTVRTKPEWLN